MGQSVICTFSHRESSKRKSPFIKTSSLRIYFVKTLPMCLLMYNPSKSISPFKSISLSNATFYRQCHYAPPKVRGATLSQRQVIQLAKKRNLSASPSALGGNLSCYNNVLHSVVAVLFNKCLL